MAIPLPFLEEKSKNNGGATEIMGPDPGMEAAAQDLLSAIKADDAKAVAAALRNAFELADSEPHEEGSHE